MFRTERLRDKRFMRECPWKLHLQLSPRLRGKPFRWGKHLRKVESILFFESCFLHARNYLTFQCVDVDECERGSPCGRGALCRNTEGGYRCECPPGFAGDPHSEGCISSNECARNPCGRNALCKSLEGSYRCSCPPGFKGDPLRECVGM